MKKLFRFLATLSLLLIAASFATCIFGVQHEINKIPPERRAAMSDFDWIGIEWIFLGMAIQAVAVLLAATAVVLWFLQRRRAKKPERPSEPNQFAASSTL